MLPMNMRITSIAVDFLLIKQIPRGRNVFVRSLFKLHNSTSARNFGCRPKKKVFAANWFNFSPEFLNFAPKFSEYQNKNVFVTFWFYLSPEFRISCCQVDITSQNTEGARHLLPPSVPDPTGRCPLFPLEIDASDYIHNTFEGK